MREVKEPESWSMRGIQKLSLRSRILLVVAMSCTLGAVISISGFLYFNKKELETGILNKERTIHTQLAAATDFVAKQGGLKDVIVKFQSKYQSPDQLTEDDKLDVLKQVPIFAAMSIGKKNAEMDHYQFRVFSDEPRKKENQANAHELEIFKRFEASAELSEQIDNDGQVITLYRPVRLSKTQGCLACHGDPSTSPWKNGTDIIGHKMENWSDGKLHGVFAVSQNIQAVAKASTEGHLITPANWLVAFIVIGAVLALLVAFYVIRGPLNNLTQVATVLSDASLKVNSASQEIATSAQELSHASTEQAASLEETAASIEQMNSMVRKNSENAKGTAQTSNDSRAKAQSGQQVVEKMIQSMSDINDSNNNIMNQINQSNSEMAEILKVIQEIGNKTKVIDDIVFQTKLLSFNASVEAARAGEHGKGFAVVAEEVGNLAQMSGNAAKEISSMLDGSLHKVEDIVQNTKGRVEILIAEGRNKVEAGTDVARQCAEVLEEIVTNVSSVSRMSDEISSASQEQAQGVQELTKAMHELDQVTQQNAMNSQRSASAAESLSTQSESLKGAISQLLETIQGAGEVGGEPRSHSVRSHSDDDSGSMAA